MSCDVCVARRALHRRSELACLAATSSGVPGRFRTWEHAGLLAVSASDPALRFLSTVSGLAPATVPAAADLAASPAWNGIPPVLVGSPGAGGGSETEEMLVAAGFVRGDDAGLAVMRLARRPPAPPRIADTGPDAADAGADPDGFVRTLLAGYEVDGAVARFIEAEHRDPGVRRFLAVDQGVTLAAAAMTVHGDVAVLGGASTLRAHRGRGAQQLLLRHRLGVAADAGCVLAVATAVPGSVSATNLARVGFTVHRRPVWTRRQVRACARGATPDTPCRDT